MAGPVVMETVTTVTSKCDRSEVDELSLIMASQPMSTPKRDWFKAFFRGKTPQQPESSNNIAVTSPLTTPLPLSSNVVPAVTNVPYIPPSSQKAFVKSKFFEKDIAILSATYILEENPELKRLIHLIISIHEKDEEDQLTGVLETCAKVSVQLVSTAQTHRAEATEAITTFIKTVEKINLVQLDSDAQSLQALRSMVNDEIAKIKSSHPIFGPDRDIGTSEGLFKVLWANLGVGITFLDVVKEVSTVIPIPWIRPVIGGVVSLLNAVLQTRSNYDDMKQIAATAGDFVLSCAVILSDRITEPSNELKRALNRFTKTLEGIAQECDDLSRLNPFRRYVQQNIHNINLQAIKTRLNTAIELFQTQSQVNIQLDVRDLRRNLDYAVLNSLPNHPYYKPNEYLSGSQDGVLGYISGWIDEPKESVLWMHGAAGLGKSTAAQQLVHLLQSADRLAGGVFLTNLTWEHPETVIQMISRQLGEMHPRAITDIAEAARKLHGPHRSLRDYFMTYIIEPVHALKYPYELVIVIDGLDEWTNYESFLAELAHIPSPCSLKFVIISRPNHSIGRILNKIPVQQYALLPVSQEIIENYFIYHFEMIDWRGRKPDKNTINQLAAHAHGLLIWAATVRSLLSHESDDRYPHVILGQILLSEEKVGIRSGESLERLYRGAIATLFPEPHMLAKLHDFLGGMIVLQEALPIRDFVRLLGMPDRPAEEIQRRLNALQTRGNFNPDVIPPAIQRFHVSFLEFIESTATECNGRLISVNTANAHLTLATRCLTIVFSELLKSHRGQTCVYYEFCGVERYAIKFWPLHLSNGRPRLLPSTKLSEDLIDVSEEAMRRWATLFLPCVSPKFQDGYGSWDNIPRSEVPYHLAAIMGWEDVTTLLYVIHCLEIAVRLQPIDVRSWMALGAVYNRLYEHSKLTILNPVIGQTRLSVTLPEFPSSSGLTEQNVGLQVRNGNKHLDEAIAVFREALQLVLHKSASKGSLDSDVNVDVARDVGGPEPIDTSRTDTQGDILWLLADALHTRFSQRGASNDIDEAISLHREALFLLPAERPNHPMLLNDLARSLLTRFEHGGTSNNLDEAISLLREALILQLAPHPDRIMSVYNLANALLICFRRRGSSNDLDEMISLYREALVLKPAPDPDYALSLNNLASSLLIRFEQRGPSNDLDEAISLYREALFLHSAPHPNRSRSLNTLANALYTCFIQGGSLNDLEEAIYLHREALVLEPEPHPDRPKSLNDLANTLKIRFEHQGTLNDLDEAISLYREALSLWPATHPLRSVLLRHLSQSLQDRFQDQGVTPDDLDEVISLYREILVLQPAPHPDRPRSLNNLAQCLQVRSRQQGTSKDLDEAIFLHREVLILHPAPHPDRPGSLINLAKSLQTRSEQQGTSNDIDEAISLHREALILHPAPHPDRPGSLINLAKSLQTRSAQQSTSNDLDEAISLRREALVLQSTPHPDRPRSLNDLGNTLSTRFKQQGASNDVDEAIFLYREALAILPACHPDRSMLLFNLANAIRTCFDNGVAPSDLDEVISLYREALVLQSTSHPDRPRSLNNLGNTLETRFKQQGTLNDLDEAISLHQEALVLWPAAHPLRSASLGNLFNCLVTRLELPGTSNDLDESLSFFREAFFQPD